MAYVYRRPYRRRTPRYLFARNSIVPDAVIGTSGGVTFGTPTIAGTATAVGLGAGGGVTFAAPTLTGTATSEGLDAAGGVTFGAPTIAGVATYTDPPAYTAAGGVTFAKPTLAGTATFEASSAAGVTQAVAEVFGHPTVGQPGKITQAVVEAFGRKAPEAVPGYLTQADLEVFGGKVAPAYTTQAVIEVFGLPLLVPPTVLCLDVKGLIGYPYYAIFVATGGRPPYTFAITAGALPDGLTLDTASGVVSGTPTTAGDYAYTVRVTDSSGSPALFGEASCTLVVTDLPPPPLEYEPPCQIQTPEVWACLQDASGVVRANIALRAAMRDPADFLGGYKAPRLLSAGVVNRAASDWLNRTWSAQTCDITISEADYAIANLAGLGSQQRSQFYLYLTSESNRRLQALPRLLFQGPIYSDDTSDLQRRVTANDILGVEYEILTGGVQIPKRTITGVDFPAATTQGQAVPIIGGRVTDADYTLNGGADAGNPEWGHGPIRLSYGAVEGIDVGVLTVNGLTKRAVLFAGHALTNYDHLYLFNTAAFGPVLFQDGLLTNNGIAAAQYGVSVWVPGKPGYTAFNPSGDPFVDINGRRYSIVFVNDTIAAQLDNGYKLRANVQGAEDVGDGSGDLIEDAGELCEWMFLNWLVGDYQSGAWLASPTFEFYPGSSTFSPPIVLDRINHAGFLKASAIGAGLVAGGLKGSFVVGAQGNRQTSTDVIAEMLRSWNLMLRWNQFNQLEIVMLDRRRDVFLGTDHGVTWKADILTSPRFKATVKGEWFANLVQGTWGVFWVDYPYWHLEPGTPTSALWIENSASREAYGLVAKPLTLRYVLDHATARAVLQQYCDFASVPRFVATWAQSLCALREDVLDGVLVTHYAGPQPNGWTRQGCWILAQRINAAAAFVEVDAVNIDDLLD